MEDRVAVDNAGAVGGDVFGSRDVFGEDVADEGGADGMGDDGAEGSLLGDNGGGIGDTEHWVGAFPVAAGDAGAERIGGVRFWRFVGMGVAVVAVVVVVMMVVDAGRQVSSALGRAGYAGLLLERGNAAGVQGAGGGGTSGLDAGVWEELDQRGEVLLRALGGAGQGDHHGAIADAGDRARHHRDCGMSVRLHQRQDCKYRFLAGGLQGVILSEAASIACLRKPRQSASAPQRAGGRGAAETLTRVPVPPSAAAASRPRACNRSQRTPSLPW